MADALRVRSSRMGAGAARPVVDAIIWNPAKTADTILGRCKMRNAGITGSGHAPRQHGLLLGEQGQ